MVVGSVISAMTPQPATTSWTDRDIDIEYPLEPLCPGGAWVWHECNQLADEVEGREHHVGSTIPEGMFELILHLCVGTGGQTVEADGGSANIAA